MVVWSRETGGGVGVSVSNIDDSQRAEIGKDIFQVLYGNFTLPGFTVKETRCFSPLPCWDLLSVKTVHTCPYCYRLHISYAVSGGFLSSIVGCVLLMGYLRKYTYLNQ